MAIRKKAQTTSGNRSPSSAAAELPATATAEAPAGENRAASAPKGQAAFSESSASSAASPGEALSGENHESVLNAPAELSASSTSADQSFTTPAATSPNSGQEKSKGLPVQQHLTEERKRSEEQRHPIEAAGGDKQADRPAKADPAQESAPGSENPPESAPGSENPPESAPGSENPPASTTGDLIFDTAPTDFSRSESNESFRGKASDKQPVKKDQGSSTQEPQQQITDASISRSPPVAATPSENPQASVQSNPAPGSENPPESAPGSENPPASTTGDLIFDTAPRSESNDDAPQQQIPVAATPSEDAPEGVPEKARAFTRKALGICRTLMRRFFKKVRAAIIHADPSSFTQASRSIHLVLQVLYFARPIMLNVDAIEGVLALFPELSSASDYIQAVIQLLHSSEQEIEALIAQHIGMNEAKQVSERMPADIRWEQVWIRPVLIHGGDPEHDVLNLAAVLHLVRMLTIRGMQDAFRHQQREYLHRLADDPRLESEMEEFAASARCRITTARTTPLQLLLPHLWLPVSGRQQVVRSEELLHELLLAVARMVSKEQSQLLPCFAAGGSNSKMSDGSPPAATPADRHGPVEALHRHAAGGPHHVSVQLEERGAGGSHQHLRGAAARGQGDERRVSGGLQGGQASPQVPRPGARQEALDDEREDHRGR